MKTKKEETSTNHWNEIKLTQSVYGSVTATCITEIKSEKLRKNVVISREDNLGHFSSMFRHGLVLIFIKSYNDHNFMKIYQKLPKFGNLGKIGNLNFPVT